MQKAAELMRDKIDEIAKLEDIFRHWEQDQDPAHLKKVEIVLARLKYLNNLKQPKG